MLQELWGKSNNIDLVPSPSPPHAAGARSNAATGDSIETTLRPHAHLQVCIKAVKQVLNLSSFSSSPSPCQVLLLANLFALEAVHMAEVFGLPLVMAHPYPAPASLPFNFKAHFRRTDPLQYKALRKGGRRDGGREGGREDATVGGNESVISWEDVEHWLWPAFAESWSPFRRMLLGLDEEEGEGDELPLPWLAGRPSIPLLYLYSESILPRPQSFPVHAHVVGYVWPEETRESYISCSAFASFLAGRAVVGRAEGDAAAAASSTASATMAGLGWKDGDRETRAAVAAAIAATITNDFCPAVAPVFVTFGTMISLGALGDLTCAAKTVVAAVLSSSPSSSPSFSSSSNTTSTTPPPPLRCVLDAAGTPSWAAALREALSVHQQRQQQQNEEGGHDNSHRIFILEEAVPHSWLIPKCSVVVHHGGSGTTAAALLAGVAQVTVPGMMDQFQWAERVAGLDLGPPPLSLVTLFPHDDDEEEEVCETDAAPPSLLAAAIAQASHPSTRLRAAAVGRRLRAKPSGLERCIELIRGHLEEWKSLFSCSTSSPMPRRPPLPLPLPAGCELLTLELFEDDDVNGGGTSNNERKQPHEDDEKNNDTAAAAAVAAAASSALTVASLQGSESEIAFIHQEIFPPPGRQEKGGWGYLKHGVHVKEGDVILDIGANIGLFALYLDLYVMEEPDQISIMAVEPAPRTFAALQYNLAAHGVKVVACVQQAVGDETSNTISNDEEQGQQEAPSHAMLRFYPHAPGNSSLASAQTSTLQGKTRFRGVNPRLRAHLEKGAEDVLVEMTSISALVRRYSLSCVDLLKVDVEGSEEAVLQGINEETWPLIRQVVMEVHNVDGREARIDAVFRSRGFGKVVWETPPWAVGVGGGGGSSEEMDNRMVFACRA